MAVKINAPKNGFQLSKRVAIAGLAIGFLVWHIAFMSVGGKWFGMWISKEWNGVPDAFRFLITIILVPIYLAMPDEKIKAEEV